MKRNIHLVATTFICLFSSLSFAQFSVGHTTITFSDPSRTGGFGSGGGPGRQIQTEIYYPADVAGVDVPVSNSSFPIVVFGHGFAMSWDAYENIWEELVVNGYIVAFPRTEGGLFPGPSHDDFSLDLMVVKNEMDLENTDVSSLFYNHITSKSAIMGHSMGGGATFLTDPAANNVTTIIGLAPAETTPSAIANAANITVPALVFSADEDMVTPAIDHHTPIYNALSSSCKYFINIIGGAHCYYANSNFNCDLGEGSSGGNITISRTTQQAITYRYVIPWLDMYLYDDCTQQDVFLTDIQLDTEVTYLSSCSGFPIAAPNLNVTVNSDTLVSDQSGSNYQWIDCDNGNAPIAGANSQTFIAPSSGHYAVIVGYAGCEDTSACHNVTTLGINDYQNQKRTLVKVVDILGRERKPEPNIPLIYIYSDGTVQKKIILDY